MKNVSLNNEQVESMDIIDFMQNVDVDIIQDTQEETDNGLIKVEKKENFGDKHKHQNKYLTQFMKDSPFLTKKTYSKEITTRVYTSSISRIEITGEELNTFDEDVLLVILNSPYLYDELLQERYFTITQFNLREKLNKEKSSEVYKRIRESIDKLKHTNISVALIDEEKENYKIEKFYNGNIISEENGTGIEVNYNVINDKNTSSYLYKIKLNSIFLKMIRDKEYTKYYNIEKRFMFKKNETKSISRYLQQHVNFSTKGTIKENIINLYKKCKIDMSYYDSDKKNIRWNIVTKQLEEIKTDILQDNIKLEYELIEETVNGVKTKALYTTFTKIDDNGENKYCNNNKVIEGKISK